MKKFFITFSVLLSFTFINAQNCVNFTLKQDTVGVQSPTFGVALADFNGDGWLDVVTIDAYSDIEIYFNNGDGTLDTMNYLTLGEERWRFGVNAFDIDDDGDMDFITTPMSSQSYGIEVWENNGSGTFTLKSDNLANHSSGYEAAIGDLNGDGYDDIMFPNNDKVSILLNDGTGNFTDNGQDISASDPEGATLFDADADGDLDAVVYRGFPDLLFINDGTGQFSQAQELAQDDTEGIGVADIDGDGDLDVVVAPWHGAIEFWMNDGLGSFVPGDTLKEYSEFYNEIAMTDLNYDGYLDIITDAGIFTNDVLDIPDSVHFTEQLSFSTSSHDLDIGDLNKDGLIDIYIGRFSSSNGDNIYWRDAPEYINVDTTICYGDSIFLQNAWQTEPGTYFDNAGCDTVLLTTLSFFDQINTNVTLSDGTLTAEATGVSYQWINCDSGDTIVGATSQTFTPDTTGNYAVILSNANCSATSECIYVALDNYNITFNVTDEAGTPLADANISINGDNLVTDGSGTTNITLEAGTYPYEVSLSGYLTIQDTATISADTTIEVVMQNEEAVNSLLNNVVIYPNPNNGIFTISLPDNATVVITDIAGSIIYKSLIINSLQIDISNQPAGIYFIKITSENSNIIKKIIKK